ncbi:hypothetical protein MVEN_00813600 [Mycena venus]|uniref:F-box domain-containing protein n=1 Tax=Mycena venus TaxID=2733690 RepID=A0A8H6YGR1_9AGAR|nr:hypothetical protein MVEN_00813600 [Mycena venus]
MPPTLPTELVAYIIDLIDDADRDSLLSCSLVSRSWVQSSQSHLFRNISLPYRPFWQRYYPGVSGVLCHLLNNILFESPHLAHYIQTLEIVDNNGRNPGWVTSEPSLTLLLPKLSALRRLSLTHLIWDTLSEDRQQSFISLLARPTLTSVHLTRCKFPTFLHLSIVLSTALSLERLSLDGAYFNSVLDLASEPHAEQSLHEPVTLGHLTLKNTHLLPGTLNSSVLPHVLDITRLRSFCCDRTCYPSVAPLLPLLGRAGTLERLELVFIPKPADFDLRLVTSLRHLSIGRLVMTVGDESLARSLVGFLSNIYALTQLEVLQISVVAETRPPSECIKWDAWARFDDLLTTSSLDHLRRVALDVCVVWDNSLTPCTPPIVKSELARLETTLPKLARRGVLQVEGTLF